MAWDMRGFLPLGQPCDHVFSRAEKVAHRNGGYDDLAEVFAQDGFPHLQSGHR